MVNKPALTSSVTETMTTGGTYNDQPMRRGSKRARQNMNSSSESGSEESGTSLKDTLDSKKPGSRPASPRKPGGETAADEITRAVPEAGWPGSSGQRKAEVEPGDHSKKASPSPDNEPLNIRGKETCKSGKLSRHVTRKNHLKRYPHDILADAARGKRKKSYGSDTSMSTGNSIASSRDRKRVKTDPKGSATDDSFEALLLKVEEVSSKMNGPNDAGPSSRHMKRKYGSKQSSEDSESMDNSRSMNSKSSYSRCKSSGKSSAKSSERGSARSMESMDGHTELLESLVHAAHAEDKLHKEKESLQRELQVLQRRNDKLQQELLYALKVVDKLRTKCKHASRSSHDMESKFLAEKAKLEKELQASLKQEQIARKLNNDKSVPAQKR